MRDRWNAAVRWILVPWTQAAVALALIGAAAAPALLMSAADVWTVSAGDDFAERLASEITPVEAGVVVITNAVFAQEPSLTAAQVVTDRIAAIEAVAPAVVTLWTTRDSGEVGTSIESATNPGVPLRVMARDGALDALSFIDRDPSIASGAYISAYLADRNDIGVGDFISYAARLAPEPTSQPAGGPRTTWPIAGVYETIWSEDGIVPNAYWEAVPPALLPRYLSPFNAPSFSLVLLEPETLGSTLLSGFMQWEAPTMAPPATIDAMRSQVGAYRGLEIDLATDPTIVPALEDLAAVQAARPVTASLLGEQLVTAEAALAALNQPLSSTRIAGVLVGLAILVAAGVYLVQRGRLEYRLLAGEGDRWRRFSGRTAAQLLLPVALGTLVGVVAGVTVAVLAGPAESIRLDVIDVGDLAAVAVLGLVLTSTVTGLLAQRTLDTGHIGRRTNGTTLLAVVFAVAAFAFLWIQVARLPARGETSLDLTVVAMPLVGLMAAVALVIVFMQMVVGRGRFMGSRLPAPLFLAWRRATANDLGSLLIVGALAVGIGLVALSTILVGSLERTTNAKVSTLVGGETKAELVALPSLDPPLPPNATLIAYDPARISPDNRPARLIAIDTATYADAVSWPEEFGSSAEDVAALLDSAPSDGLAVVMVDAIPAPLTGSIGAQRLPYEVVGTVSSAPLAYPFGATLLVSADRLDAFARQRLANQLGVGPENAMVESRFRSLLVGYRKNLVTQASTQTVMTWAEENAITTRTVESRFDLENGVDIVAAGTAFDYMRILGWVAALAAVAALTLHRAAMRSERAVASLMTRRMGLSRRRAALVSAIEVVVLTSIALVTAFVIAPVLTWRLLPRFDPAPGLPPPAVVAVEPLVLLGAFAMTVGAIAGLVWVLEVTAARTNEGSVLRASQ